MNERSLLRLRTTSRLNVLAAALLATTLLAGCQTRNAADHAAATAGGTPQPPPATGDPRALEIADHVMANLGGRERWDALRGLRWTFGSEIAGVVRGNPRRHAWDKTSGWHRVEGRNRAGQSYLIVHNIMDSTGSAWVDGTPIEGDSLKKLVAFGKSLWTNDSYWFLMPYKLRDPGVTLAYAGADSSKEHVWDKVALSFGQVGETPGDHYWVYVDRPTGRVERWDFVLEGDQPPPDSWTWEGWEQHDALWFATARKQIGADPPDSARTVFTKDVETVAQFPAEEFKRP